MKQGVTTFDPALHLLQQATCNAQVAVADLWFNPEGPTTDRYRRPPSHVSKLLNAGLIKKICSFDHYSIYQITLAGREAFRHLKLPVQ